MLGWGKSVFINKTSDGRNNLSGRAIGQLRKQRGLSQRALADQMQLLGIDLDKNAVQRIESGQRFVTDIELQALSVLFGVSADDLLSALGTGPGTCTKTDRF